MLVLLQAPRLELKFVMCSPKSSADPIQRMVLEQIHTFWFEHWSETFSKTGAPESGWERHFHQQDIVVALMHGSNVIGCHLYTFYDLRDEGVRSNGYFGYFKDSSIQSMLAQNVPRMMTMEYLGVSPTYSRNIEQLSIGKLLVALATYAGNEAGADAVIGTPISTTKVAQMMDNVGSITLEDGIPKYGYELSLRYARVQPRTPSADQYIASRAEELWRSREVLNRLNTFTANKRAA